MAVQPLLVVALVLLASTHVQSFSPAGAFVSRHRIPIARFASPSKDGAKTDEVTPAPASTVQDDMNPLTRASWYAVEAFGKAFGSGKNGEGSAVGQSSADAVDLSRPPRSLKEALRRIELDNDREYFLSGEVDALAYTDDCVFSDPFVSFSGRDRFVDNLQNLGSFITEYDAKMLGYDVSDDGTTVKTKVMVKVELNLPWKPILAWPWGVTYAIDPETYLIASHAESWDIEPWEGVKQIFRKPTLKINKK